MNIERVKQQLTERYPGVVIKDATVTQGVVTEIIGEIDRKLVDSVLDVAVVVADRSVEHQHKIITEEYEVIKGNLRVYRDGQPSDLHEGEKIVINPSTWHYVEGNETWFYCYSAPDWFAGDFYPRKATKQ